MTAVLYIYIYIYITISRDNQEGGERRGEVLAIEMEIGMEMGAIVG